MVQVYKIRSDDHSLALKIKELEVVKLFLSSSRFKPREIRFNMLIIKICNSLPQDIMKNKSTNGFGQIRRKNKKILQGLLNTKM